MTGSKGARGRARTKARRIREGGKQTPRGDPVLVLLRCPGPPAFVRALPRASCQSITPHYVRVCCGNGRERGAAKALKKESKAI